MDERRVIIIVTQEYHCVKWLQRASVIIRMEKIAERGNRRFAVNIVRTGRTPETASLDMIADLEAWLRKAYPLYKHSWSTKTKAQGVREYLKAVYILLEEFFQECRDQNIDIPNSALVLKSDIERAIEG